MRHECPYSPSFTPILSRYVQRDRRTEQAIRNISPIWGVRGSTESWWSSRQVLNRILAAAMAASIDTDIPRINRSLFLIGNREVKLSRHDHTVPLTFDFRHPRGGKCHD